MGGRVVHTPQATHFYTKPGHEDAGSVPLLGRGISSFPEMVILAWSVPQTQRDLVVPSGKCFQ